KTNVFALDAATGRTLWSREFGGGATFAPLVVANGVLFAADAGGRVRGLDAATGAVRFQDRLTLPLPDPGNPGGVVFAGPVVTALSVGRGRLYVAHGIPIPGAHPGGVTVYALPSGPDPSGSAPFRGQLPGQPEATRTADPAVFLTAFPASGLAPPVGRLTAMP